MNPFLPCLFFAASLAACGGIDGAHSSACAAASGTAHPLLQSAPHGILENLVVAGDHVYFNDTSRLALLSVPVTGGAPATVVPTTDGEFAVGGGSVAWTPVVNVPHGDGTTTTTSVSVEILDAKGRVTLGLPAGTASISRVAADPNGDVYYEADGATSTLAVVMRWSAATRTVSELSREAFLGWLDRGEIFWSDGTAFYSLDVAGGSPKRLASIPAGSSTPLLGFDAENLYYWLVSATPGHLDGFAPLRIGGVPRAGGPAFVAFERAGLYQLAIQMIAIDDSGVYFADAPNAPSPGSTIYRAKLVHGSTEEVLARRSSTSSGIALGACAVYGAESGPSGEPQIVSVAK